MKIISIIVTVLLIGGAPVWAVNKCLINEKAVYQNEECSQGSETQSLQSNISEVGSVRVGGKQK